MKQIELNLSFEAVYIRSTSRGWVQPIMPEYERLRHVHNFTQERGTRSDSDHALESQLLRARRVLDVAFRSYRPCCVASAKHRLKSETGPPPRASETKPGTKPDIPGAEISPH